MWKERFRFISFICSSHHLPHYSHTTYSDNYFKLSLIDTAKLPLFDYTHKDVNC